MFKMTNKDQFKIIMIRTVSIFRQRWFDILIIIFAVIILLPSMRRIDTSEHEILFLKQKIQEKNSNFEDLMGKTNELLTQFVNLKNNIEKLESRVETHWEIMQTRSAAVSEKVGDVLSGILERNKADRVSLFIRHNGKQATGGGSHLLFYSMTNEVKKRG